MAQVRPTTALLLALILLCTLAVPSHCAVSDQHLPIAVEDLLDRRIAPLWENPPHALPEDSPQSFPENSSQCCPEDSSQCCPEDSSQSCPEDSSHDSSHVPKPKNLKYDPNLSLKAVHYSKAAHCSIDELRKCKDGHACKIFPSFELHRVHEDDMYDTLYYVGVQHNENRIVLAFYGELTLLGVIEDLLQAGKVPYKNKDCGWNCEVHANTYIAYQHLRKGIVKDVLRLRRMYPDYSLLVTGHSLGGALATLCAVDLATFTTVDNGSMLHDASFLESGKHQLPHHGLGTRKLVPTDLYTFGQPRVGNPEFVQWASSVLSDTSTFRVTHGGDAVPHLPLTFFDYIHLSQEVWYYNPEHPHVYRLCMDSPTAEDPKCSASLPLTNIFDHLYYLGIFMECDTLALSNKEGFNTELLTSYVKFNEQHYSYH